MATNRQIIWDLLRSMPAVTASELVEVSIGAGYAGIGRNVTAYLHKLELAGIVASQRSGTHPRKNGHLQMVFALIRDLGPIAPVYSRDHNHIQDRNTGQIIQLPLVSIRGREGEQRPKPTEVGSDFITLKTVRPPPEPLSRPNSKPFSPYRVHVKGVWR